MKLYNPATRSAVDYYPLKSTSTGKIYKGQYLRCYVTTGGRTIERIETSKEMRKEVDRLVDIGYGVAGFSTDPEIFDPAYHIAF